MKKKFRNAYTGTDHKVGFSSDKPSLTKQSFKDSVDVNNIMAKYQKTGIVDHFNKYEGRYVDLDASTFTENQMIVANAMSMFEELPSKARNHFNNDPAAFLEYVSQEQTPDSNALLGELGLLNTPDTLAIPGDEKSVPDVTGRLPDDPQHQENQAPLEPTV